LTRLVWSPWAVSVASTVASNGGAPSPFRYDSSDSLHVTRNRRGGSQASTRPLPSHSTDRRNSPPGRRSPSTWPHHRARRSGSVIADHRSSISVSYRSSIRTTPTPSADRRLPSSPAPPRTLLLIYSRPRP